MKSLNPLKGSLTGMFLGWLLTNLILSEIQDFHHHHKT